MYAKSNSFNWNEQENASTFFDTLKNDRFGLLVCFEGEDKDPSEHVIFSGADYKVMKEVIKDNETIKVYNVMRIVDFREDANDDLETYSAVYAEQRSFYALKEIAHGLRCLEELLYEPRSQYGALTAEEMLDFIKQVAKHNNESLFDVLTATIPSVELNTDITDFEDFGKWYAEEYLDYNTVYTLEDYVDWEQFGRDTYDNQEIDCFFSDYGLVTF